MQPKNINQQRNKLAIIAIVVAIGVSSYFLYFSKHIDVGELLIKVGEVQNNENIQINDTKQEPPEDILHGSTEEMAIDADIKCINKAKIKYANFGSSYKKADPFFYETKDAVAFNNNAKISEALSAYISCMNIYDRKYPGNWSIKQLNEDANEANGMIRWHLQLTKNDQPEICLSPILEDISRTICEEIRTKDYIVSEEFIITQTDHVKGNDNAEVTLIEYSDFQCIFCSRHKETLERILQDYPDQVRLVYRHFPLKSHPYAQKAAEASECAAQQGKFWEMHDMLFLNRQKLTAADIKSYAINVKLDTDIFNQCLDSSATASDVDEDIKTALSAGVNGTPATFINNKLIVGSLSYELFKQEVDREF